MDSTEPIHYSSKRLGQSSQHRVEVREHSSLGLSDLFSIINIDHLNTSQFLDDGFPFFLTFINRAHENNCLVGASVCFIATFEKIIINSDDEKREFEKVYLHTKNECVYFEINLKEYYNSHIRQYVLYKIDELHDKGFKLNKIKALNILIRRYEIFDSDIKNDKFPEFAMESKRLASFTGWPKSLKQKPNQMSVAGFFYTGFGDEVNCFSCGGILNQWEENDDAWEEHGFHYEKCQYMRQCKGWLFHDETLNKKGRTIL